MLAITSSNSITISEPSILKRGPPTLGSTRKFSFAVKASAWSSDGKTMYLAESNRIRELVAFSGTLLEATSITGLKNDISHLIQSQSGPLFFSAGRSVYVLESGCNAKTLGSAQNHRILALAVSHDGSLLASISTRNVVVRSLAKSEDVLSSEIAHRSVRAAVFQPFIGGCLLLADGHSLLVYDTSRSKAPPKIVLLSDTEKGDICGIACSPFSKNLVVVVTQGGFAGMVDLEAEQNAFRIVDLKNKLTCVAFAPDGSAFYAGTETGEILFADLRALDKSARKILISSNGTRIEAIHVQNATQSNSSARSESRLPSKSTTSPPLLAPRAHKASQVARPLQGAPELVLAFRRDPTGNARSDRISSHTRGEPAARRTTSHSRVSSRTATMCSSPVKTKENLVESTAPGAPRNKTASTSSKLSTMSTKNRAKADTLLTSFSSSKRTPSPDLPEVERASGVPGGQAWPYENFTLITPENRQRTRSSEGRAREFIQEKRTQTRADDHELAKLERAADSDPVLQRSNLQQIPPAFEISPPGMLLGSSSSGARDLLRAVVGDALYDFRTETRSELNGLHLDMIRMGRSWKHGLRELMQEYVGDFRDLREENARLREENARLRRGY